jgi:hypothetical protein
VALVRQKKGLFHLGHQLLIAHIEQLAYHSLDILRTEHDGLFKRDIFETFLLWEKRPLPDLWMGPMYFA